MKKKQILLMTLAILTVTSVSISAWAITRHENKAAPIVDGNTVLQSELGKELKDYSAYSKFDLIYDEETETLMYHGQVVRYFVDQYSLDAESTATICEYINENGTIDLYTERDQTKVKENADGSFDPNGTLLSVKQYSQDEFAKRDLNAVKNPASQGAEAGKPMSLKEKATLYSEYEAFGLNYDRNRDVLIYKGKTVRYFLDIRSSNGKDLSSGEFEGVMNSIINDENGEVDLYTVRNFDKLNTNGEGKLTKIKAYSQSEFDQRTAEWSVQQNYDATMDVIKP